MSNAYQKEYTEQEYEELLNSIYEPITICGYTFEQGTALKHLDPTAFRCGQIETLSDTWVCDTCNNEYDTEAEANECCTE